MSRGSHKRGLRLRALYLQASHLGQSDADQPRGGISQEQTSHLHPCTHTLLVPATRTGESTETRGRKHGQHNARWISEAPARAPPLMRSQLSTREEPARSQRREEASGLRVHQKHVTSGPLLRSFPTNPFGGRRSPPSAFLTPCTSTPWETPRSARHTPSQPTCMEQPRHRIEQPTWSTH